MFHFGLFSTFIPYLLISIAYLGFLGNNALEKNQFLYQTNIVTRYDFSFSDNYSEITTDNQTDIANLNYSIFSLTNQDFICFEKYKIPWEHRSFKSYCLQLSTSILSRPPPSLM